MGWKRDIVRERETEQHTKINRTLFTKLAHTLPHPSTVPLRYNPCTHIVIVIVSWTSERSSEHRHGDHNHQTHFHGHFKLICVFVFEDFKDRTVPTGLLEWTVLVSRRLCILYGCSLAVCATLSSSGGGNQRPYSPLPNNQPVDDSLPMRTTNTCLGHDCWWYCLAKGIRLWDAMRPIALACCCSSVGERDNDIVLPLPSVAHLDFNSLFPPRQSLLYLI